MSHICKVDPAWRLTGAGSAVELRFVFPAGQRPHPAGDAAKKAARSAVEKGIKDSPYPKMIASLTVDIERVKERLADAERALGDASGRRQTAIESGDLTAAAKSASTINELASFVGVARERLAYLESQLKESQSALESVRAGALAEAQRRQVAALSEERKRLLDKMGEVISPLLERLLSIDRVCANAAFELTP